MRKFLQMLLPLLLAGAMVWGMMACTPSTPEQSVEETSGSTESGAEDSTAADTPDVPDTEVVKAEREQLTFDAAVTIAEQDGGARVAHKDGLSYLAIGYTSIEGNMLHFTKDLVLQFDGSLTADAFNRFTIGYVSTQPLYGTVTYTVDGKRVTDDFYLEAGKDTFSCVIGQYLDGKKGKEIHRMTFESCNDQPAEFALCVLRVHTEEYLIS